MFLNNIVLEINIQDIIHVPIKFEAEFLDIVVIKRLVFDFVHGFFYD